MWYIGQDIVCIKSHRQKIVKEGEVYTIKALTQGCCFVLIDVGLKTESIYLRCDCGCRIRSNAVSWLDERLFKPLDELSDISELLEVLELETVV